MKNKITIIILITLASPLLLLCFSYSSLIDVPDYNNNLNYENRQLILSWDLLEKGEYSRAKEIVFLYYDKGSKNNDMWCVLLASIYLNEKKYSEAVLVINRIRRSLELKYNNELKTKSKNEIIEFAYYRMLIISAECNYNMNYAELAIRDYLLYSKKRNDPDVFDRIATCYYSIGDYRSSIDYFIMAFNGQSNFELKLLSAYNIGAVNSKIMQVGEAIKWLKIPLETDAAMWIKKIYEDRDFQDILQTPEFADFLNCYKNR